MNGAGFLLALIISVILVPLIHKFSIAKGYYDKPDERKIHTDPIPRLGGVAIFSGFIISFAVITFFSSPELNDAIWGILISSTLMFAMGLMDDMKSLSPYLKLFVQFGAALVAFYLGVQISSLDLPQSKLLILNAFSLPVTVIWIMALTNAMNFIDGLDGLAGGVTIISSVTLTLIALFTGKPTEALLASILAGSTLGFLIYNYYPAKIFMGDSGSLFCGFMLACISVSGVLKSKIVVMLLPLFILSVPIIDITFAVFRRLFKGQNPFLPDADHLHHQFLKAGMSQVQAVRQLYMICILGGIVATGYISKEYLDYLGVYLVLLAGIYIIGAVLIRILRKERYVKY